MKNNLDEKLFLSLPIIVTCGPVHGILDQFSMISMTMTEVTASLSLAFQYKKQGRNKKMTK